MDRPSIFGSATNSRRASAGRPRNRRARAQNSENSSAFIALSSESIGTRWRSLAKPLSGRSPTILEGESGRIELREAGLDRGVAAAQGVVVGVADLRRVLLVVQAVVMRDLRCKLRQFGRGFLFGQRFNR